MSNVDILEVSCSVVLDQPLARNEVEDELNGHEILQQVPNPIVAEYDHCNEHNHRKYRENDHKPLLLLLKIRNNAVFDLLCKGPVHLV